MPYDIRSGGSGCRGGYEVVGPGGVKGCHQTRDEAVQQQRALYAAEADSKKALGKSLFGDLRKEHNQVMTNENVPNKQPHSLEDCDDQENCPDHMDKKAPCWDGYVQRGMKPGAGGRMVPNCVPVSKADTCCPDLEKAEEWEGKELYDKLSEPEKELADSLLNLADEVGPLDKANGIWVGYVNGQQNENASIGVKCGNCALHKSSVACAILEMAIEEEGACRFAVIPDGYVTVESDVEEDMSMDKADSVRVGQMVSWNSSGGRAEGRVIRVVRNGKFNVPNSSFEITGTSEDPAVAIRLYRDGEPTDTIVGHKMKTLTVKKSMEEEDLEKRSLEDLDLKPTESMAANARRGLELRRKFGRGGTAVGVARARDLSNRTELSPGTVLRMYSFFSRHEVDKQGKDWNNSERPSNGKIAWLLWGGDSGYSWAKSKRNAIMSIRSQKSNDPVWYDSAFSLRKYIDKNIQG